jgi:hypothetical protein
MPLPFAFVGFLLTYFYISRGFISAYFQNVYTVQYFLLFTTAASGRGSSRRRSRLVLLIIVMVRAAEGPQRRTMLTVRGRVKPPAMVTA